MTSKSSPLFRLNGKTVVITGGLGLIGSELASACRDAGAEVVILDIKGIKNAGNNVTNYPCDITSVASVRKALKAVLRDFGKIDVLVNNAYPRNGNYGRLFEKIRLEDWAENVHAHLGGYFNVTQQVARFMMKRKAGSIINMGSIYGMVGPDFSIYKGTSMTMPAEYAAIKGGILNLTRYLATYLAPHQIRVNAVSPGGILDGQDPRFVKNYCRRVPLGRMGYPDDISGPVLFLASDASRYVTGQNIAVDGGWTAW